MSVPVTVRALCVHGVDVLVLVVRVVLVLVLVLVFVFVFVFVFDGLMHVLVGMMLGEMQSYSFRHQCSSQNQGPSERGAEEQGELLLSAWMPESAQKKPLVDSSVPLIR